MIQQMMQKHSQIEFAWPMRDACGVQLYCYAIGTLRLAKQNRTMFFNGCACGAFGLASPTLEAYAWLAVGRRAHDIVYSSTKFSV